MRHKERADFHTHLGNLTPEEIITHSQKQQVTVLTVLDRISVDAAKIKRTQLLGVKANITVLAGVEALTKVDYKNQERFFEIIGLNFQPDHPSIQSLFSNTGNENGRKFTKKLTFQTSYLNSIGFDLDHSPKNQDRWELIYQQRPNDLAFRLCQIAADTQTNQPLIEQLQDQILEHLRLRPQDAIAPVAKWLYWQNFAVGKPGFKRWLNKFKTLVDTIHRAGGVAILAHPELAVGEQTTDHEDFIHYLFSQGIDGLEGWDAGLLNIHLARLALKQGKLVLGGSGTDLTNYQNRCYGRGEGTMYISPRRLVDLQNYQHHRQLARII